MIRVESSVTNKEFKNFTLRNLDTHIVSWCEELKRKIRNQLEEDVSDQFDVGYF